jgi:hypothetical protein
MSNILALQSSKKIEDCIATGLYDYVLTHSRMNESQKNTTKVEAFEI